MLVEQSGFNPRDYDDHLLALMATVDSRLYKRFRSTSGPEVGKRYALEIYAFARQLAGWRRAAAEARSPSDLHLAFPRQPVCLQGYPCAYRGPCLQDGELVRRDYDVATDVRWVAPATKEDPQGDLGW